MNINQLHQIRLTTAQVPIDRLHTHAGAWGCWKRTCTKCYINTAGEGRGVRWHVHRHAHNDRRVVHAAAAAVEPGLIFALLMRTALQLRCTRRARAPHMNNHRIDAAAGERTIARGGGERQGDTAEHSRRARRRRGRRASITCNAVARYRYAQNTGRRKGNCHRQAQRKLSQAGAKETVACTLSWGCACQAHGRTIPRMRSETYGKN